MDSISKIAVTIMTCTAILVCGVLIAVGKDDAASFGIILTLVLQGGTWLTTQTVAKRVNGHMTALLNSKTVSNDQGEQLAQEGTNPNV